LQEATGSVSGITQPALGRIREYKAERDLGNGEHPADEEPGEHIVMVDVLPEPDHDLDKVVLGGGVPGGEGSCNGGSNVLQRWVGIGGCSGLFLLRHRRPRWSLGEGY
jgi:hypothetical protein